MASVADQLERARKNELLDLTLRNPLISYRTLKSRGVEIIDERPPEIFRILVRENRRMSFLPLSEEQKEELSNLEDDENLGLLFEQPEDAAEDDASDGDGPADRHVDTKLQTPYGSASLQKRLLNTFYRARSSIEEEGVNTLYLALGMLTWYESPSSDTERSAPLLLVPVELDRTDVQGKFRVSFRGEEIGGNISLRAKLQQDFGLTLPLPEPAEKEELSIASDLDLRTYFGRVDEAVRNHARWHVDRTAAALGFFSFTRFLMYEDLDVSNWPSGHRPDEHPVLQKLLDEGFDATGGGIPDDAPLDPFLDPDDTHHVVDADSSQTQAILDVRHGQNLVLQGPPGTGKSQTITNIIAEAIGDGKTVLFVSEKMAALDVVKRNLDDVGLGDACLELHSHKTRKKAVLDELERTMKLGKPKVEDFTEEERLLEKTRERLNTYAEAVNAPIGETGVRPYRAYGELVQLREALSGIERPDLDIPEMRDWTRETYTDKKLLVEQVQAQIADMGVPAEHPFWGSRRTRFLPSEAQSLERIIETAQTTLRTLQERAGDLAERLHLSVPEAPDATDRLRKAAEHAAAAPDLAGIPAEAEAWSVDAGRIEDLVDAGQRYADIRDTYSDLLIPEAWSQDVFPIRQKLAKHGPKWYRWLLGEWRGAKDELAALCRGDLPSDHDARLDVLDAILESRRLQETIEEASALGERVFGRAWRGTSSDWDRLAAVAAYVIDAHQRIRSGELPEVFIDTLGDLPPSPKITAGLDEVEAADSEHREAINAFTDEIDFSGTLRFDNGRPLAEQPFDVQRSVLRECRGDVGRLQEMTTYNGLASDLDEAGLSPVREVADRWTHGPEHLVDLFRHRYYTAIVERAMDERTALDRFSRAQHEEVVERFRQLDEAALVHNRHELALEHYREKPARKGVGQVGVLLNEFGKSRRHMPLRRLMEEAGSAIQALKPVFMMSPMSVPKYLSPDAAHFDLVVFDEASQVRPVDAFGAILRGEQTVVVGDNKQLPPTSFFDTAGGGDSDGYEQRAGDQESILDLFLSRGAPERMLKFHYRSKHESLIAVSNKEFYDNDLFVFPSPDAGQEDLGLRYHHLPDTTYDRGGSRKNNEEAKRVADRVMEHARNRPDMSLGVATFSSAQQEAVRDQLEMLRRQDPSCEDFFNAHPDEPFFVKNLESVQGDQRDVMFISVGYGRDANGKVTMNFGPLNSDGGERRLNVLTTRAKYRCEVFTNLRPEDIDLHSTNARGVEVLKEYLTYAESGELDVATPTGGETDSPFEEAVADALRREGYRVEHQIGQAGFSIDLAVVDPDRPGRYLLGIECDGATYHSARMARDRDRARQAVLESLGWTIHRIWSTDWFRNPQEQLSRTVAAIEKARRRAEAEETAGEAGPHAPDGNASSEAGSDPSGEDAASLEDPASPADPVSSGDPSSSAEGANRSNGPDALSSGDTAPRSSGDVSNGDAARAQQGHATTIERADEPEDEGSIAEPYEAADLDIDIAKRLHEVPASQMAVWVRRVVRVESPVDAELVARRIMGAAGVTRLGRRIKGAIWGGIEHACRRGKVGKADGVLFWTDQDDVPIRDRSDADDDTRDIERVPAQEIAAAAREVASGAFGVDAEDLARQVSRTLGFDKMGSNIRRRIETVIASMVENGQLERRNGELVIGPRDRNGSNHRPS